MKFPAPQRREVGENLIPLINIVFLLLIFFMLAGAFSSDDIFKVDPPGSASPMEPDNEGPMILLSRDGRLALDDEPLEAAELKSRLAAWVEGAEPIGEAPPPRIRIKADQDTSADRLLDLMELLREAGVERVLLLTVKAKPD
jgi:biopolymer transport protein ExbD